MTGSIRVIASLLLGLGLAAAASMPSAAQTRQGPVDLMRGAAQGAISIERARHAGEFVVAVDKSQLLRVDQPFQEISIGNPEIADVVPITKQLVYVLGKQLGSTSLTVLGGGGRVIAVVDLVVSHDIQGLKGKLFELLPGAEIEVRPAGSSIVLSGQVSSPDQLSRALAIAERYAPEQVTNLLSVGGSQQVMLQVRFAEVQRSTAKDLGLTSLFTEGGSTAFNLVTGDGLGAGAFASALLSLDKDDFSLDLLFDALEEKGVVKTLAEPNLIVLSGDTASFLAGGEFPIPVAQEGDAGGFTITVEFKEFGVSLAFTPTVIGDGLINLVLNTEVSAIDPTTSVTTQSIEIPGLTVRRAQTTVELGDGQSFAIAGLLQDDFQDTVRQFPWLGDLPVLGTLLRSTDYQRKQTELVVVITPRLVRPAVADALATPLDDFRLPSEAELFLLGQIEGRPGEAPNDPAAALTRRSAGGIDGPHGYILR